MIYHIIEISRLSIYLSPAPDLKAFHMIADWLSEFQEFIPEDISSFLMEIDHLSIVPAIKAHCKDITNIYNQAVKARDSTMDTEFKSESFFQSKIESFSSREPFVVLKLHEKVIGYGYICLWSPKAGYKHTGEVTIYIERNHLGSGYGKRILSYLIQKSKHLEFRNLVARIWSKNEASISLFKKFGFQLVGIQHQVGFIDEKWLDIAILQRIDSSINPSKL